MSHRIGALLLPVPPPAFGPTRPNDPAVAPILDPALDVLGAFFRALLEHYCEQAWLSVAPGEPLVRKLSIGHDPGDQDFVDTELPMLALWREGEGQPVRLDDGNVQTPTQVSVLWVAPPADEQKLAARSPFFNAFCKVMQHAFQQERDPCWIKPGEEQNTVARFYGSYVWGHAGIDGWMYAGTQRVPVIVPRGEGVEPETHTGYLARWTILESTSADPAEYGSTINGVRVGTGPTDVIMNFKTSGADDAETRMSALVPPDDDT